MKKIIIILLVCSISLFSFLVALESNAFNESHFEDNYYKNNVYETTGKNYEDLSRVYRYLMLYLKGRANNEILERDFNEREILHMEDVQELFKIGFAIKYVSMIVSLILLIYLVKTTPIKEFSKSIFKGMFINWAMAGLFILMIFLDFSRYFVYFHQIFFTNDLWLLDPRTDLLIQMLPENFFYSMAKSIGISYLKNVALIQLAFFAFSKHQKDNKKEELDV